MVATRSQSVAAHSPRIRSLLNPVSGETSAPLPSLTLTLATAGAATPAMPERIPATDASPTSEPTAHVATAADNTPAETAVCQDTPATRAKPVRPTKRKWADEGGRVTLAKRTRAVNQSPDLQPNDAKIRALTEKAVADEQERQNAFILHATSARLVWSRVAEVEALKSSLKELGRALGHVEELRSRLETVVDSDLESAVQVAAARMPLAAKAQYDRTFAQYFHALIGHLVPN